MSGGVRWAVAIGVARMRCSPPRPPPPRGCAGRAAPTSRPSVRCAGAARPHGRGARSRAPARGPLLAAEPGRPTLLYLSGGPGGAGVQEFSTCCSRSAGCRSASRSSPTTSAAPARSGLLRCRTLERDARLRSTAAGEDCAGRLGARRAFCTTRDSVEDVEAVRQRARRREADAVRHLLRHEAGARLRTRAPGARGADRARLGARARRRRRLRARALPGDGRDAGRAVSRALPRRDRRSGAATSRGWPTGCAPRRYAG